MEEVWVSAMPGERAFLAEGTAHAKEPGEELAWVGGSKNSKEVGELEHREWGWRGQTMGKLRLREGERPARRAQRYQRQAWRRELAFPAHLLCAWQTVDTHSPSALHHRPSLCGQLGPISPISEVGGLRL